jgi:hypothetical protein
METGTGITTSTPHRHHGIEHGHGHEHEHEHDHAHFHEHPPQGQLERKRPSRADLAHIQGWGADLDRKNRPGVPMERTPRRFIDAPVAPPEQQPQHVEILVSPERPGITPLFGTSTPPTGLSGMIRRWAFKLTENDIRHWLLLLVADRVNMVEGIGQDLARGKVPNVLGEMGIKAELKHNPAGLAKKAAVATAVAGAAYYLLSRRNKR